MTNLPHLGHYTIPAAVISATERFLREQGAREREGLVLWVGQAISEGRFVITRHIEPRQGASALHFDVPADEMSRIFAELADLGERLLIQVHSHPAEAFMSNADMRSPVVSHRGAVSVVVPNYHSLRFRRLSDAKFFLYRAYEDWPELSAIEIDAYFTIEEAAHV